MSEDKFIEVSVTELEVEELEQIETPGVIWID